MRCSKTFSGAHDILPHALLFLITHNYVTAWQAVWDSNADEELHAAFRAFAIFGAGGTPKSAGAAGPKAPLLDSGRFVKLVRDSGLLDSRLTATAVELTFSKVKGQVNAVSCSTAPL